MASNSWIYAGVLAVACLVAVAGFILLDDDDDDEHTREYVVTVTTEPTTHTTPSASTVPDVRIGWTADFLSSIPYSELHAFEPDEGMKYLVIRFTAANDHKANGLDLSYYRDIKWTVTYDYQEHTKIEGATLYLSGYNDATLLVGGTASSAVVFQVPERLSLSEISIRAEARSFYNGLYTLAIDQSLVS